MKWSVSVISAEDEPLLHCPPVPSSDCLKNEKEKKDNIVS